jgi:predicted DNA-binding protein YlxM (UPF0122 family)
MERKRVKPDWDAIEREYRAGQLSIREIARTRNVSDKAIRNKAKAEGWEQDLSARVSEKVRTELVRTEVRTDNAQAKEIVEAAAARVVSVVREHRKDISSLRETVKTLTEQLTTAIGKREELESAIIDETSEDGNAQRRNAMLKAVALPSHASVVRELANSLKTLIALEREAFNIPSGDGASNPDDVPVDQNPIEVAARLLWVINRAKEQTSV